MALKEGKSNEESVAGKGRVYMPLNMDTCLLKWTTGRKTSCLVCCENSFRPDENYKNSASILVVAFR